MCALLRPWSLAHCSPLAPCVAAARCLHASAPVCKVRAGKQRASRNRDRPITYEQSQEPRFVGVSKSWLTLHTADLHEFTGDQQAAVVAQDEIIRRFLRGTLPNMIQDEVIIKRRGNMVAIAAIIMPRAGIEKLYWLIGYSEEMLSLILKQPVKLELQAIRTMPKAKSDIVYTFV